jgi:hypothetical protein
MIVRILTCFSLLALIAISAGSGCDSEQMDTSSPLTEGATTSTARNDEIPIRGGGEAEGPPPITQISVVTSEGLDKAGFEYAPPLDPHPPVSGEEAIAQAWQRGAVFAKPPSSVSAVLANVTWGEDSDYLRKRLHGRDLWVVTYPDACTWVFGPPPRPTGSEALRLQTRAEGSTTTEDADASATEPSNCVVQPFSSVIDAKTGEWYTSFTPGSSLG